MKLADLETRTVVKATLANFTKTYLLFDLLSKTEKYVILSKERERKEDPSHYSGSIKTAAWLIFVILRFKEKKFDHDMVQNAFCLLASLCFVLKFSDPNKDLHFKLKRANVEQEEVIPGNKKGQMETRIKELLIQITFGHETSITLLEEKIDCFLNLLNRKFSESLGLAPNFSSAHLADSLQIQELIKALKSVCTTLTNPYEVDDWIYVESLKVGSHLTLRS